MRLPSIILLVVVVAAFGSNSSIRGQTKTAPREVNVSEIGRSVILVGRLGKPLGQKMKIRGRWAKPNAQAKDYSPRFTVIELDGGKLDPPVEFNIAQITALTEEHKQALPDRERYGLLDGQTWEMVAYETGRIGLIPDEAHENAPVFPIVGRPYYTSPFTSELVAVVTNSDARAK